MGPRETTEPGLTQREEARPQEAGAAVCGDGCVLDASL